jgi:hypothetical protein
MKTGCSENSSLHIPHEEQAEVAVSAQMWLLYL